MTRSTLPEPETDGLDDLGRAIDDRASRRSFASAPVSISDVSTVLWAVQGITHTQDEMSLRASPSAGATFPLVAYLEVAPEGCDELEAGLYRYEPDTHQLERVVDEPIHDELTAAALDQSVVGGAPITVALVGDYDRTTRQYPDHGERYVHMEAGHAAQNALLVCESRGLNACPVGAFDDDELDDALGLPADLDPLYLIPFGQRTADE